MEVVYLSFAGFIIAVRFYPPNEGWLPEVFKEDLYNYHGGLIIKNLGRKKIDYTIRVIDENNIQFVRLAKVNRNLVHFYEKENDKSLTTFYHIGIYQFQIVLRIVANKLLAKHKSFLLHSSGNEIGDKAHLFLARSGGGKSTIMGLLHPTYKGIADDTIIIKQEGNHYYAYQTPFLEKKPWIKKTPKRYEIGGMYFLHKNPVFSLTKITNKNDLSERVLKSIWFDVDYPRQKVSQIIKLVKQEDYFYDLVFAKDQKRINKLRALFTNLC
ncbi:hypothetical protein A3A93_03870 [Candidatus Roizmanbacteria bacterium RIFCSPLOWO2_01_FULL_38_12]|uniref:SynChlorMet cassette protein ScmC n=1 Tax=Candidatus Roizmanbacteria bacterium RIFCSPLOWO2_01_FULL_38_12 TaxID=1802061 RepID=A0A1F7IYZ9_9BACT|nr:MAG: hypothetical protein A2861_04210 [Candidatus Roizmanbacteria bacterium RIFCSPHIGHO2_01_FULL_38_15]OGK34951.1 MAG: hypothetical protein A3F59_03820 [Candidatus Roizmanbacteria bacterium RIFCSPHIGHO2_12_FULL_38_13]OGK48577.1 MAG: hypothetical protein A3A93_03870 [Candidatus Roizmanbacteria bacterium RIFCSPLOWO2_01_FULL_38_12]